MSIISSNHRLVKVSNEGDQYSAGPGIVIEDSTISVDQNLSAAIDEKLDTSAVGLRLWLDGKNIVTGIGGSALLAEYSHSAESAQCSESTLRDEDGYYLISAYTKNSALNDVSSTLSGAIDYLSGNAGKTYSGIAPIVVNNTTNEISADSQDISFGTGLDFTNGVLSVTAHSGDPEVESVVRTNSADWGTITALSSTSSLLDNKITAVRHDLNTVTTNTGYLHTDIQTTSGILSAAIDYVSANVGDEFPASANDAITAYQTYSGTYLTAHQDISNKLDTTAFSTVSGSFLTAVDLTPYYTTADANTVSSMFSGAIDYVSANAGTTYTGISPIVVTGNTISADSFDLNIGSGLAFENNTLYVSAHGGDPEVETVVKTNSADWGTITALSSTSSILSGAIDYVSANLPDGFTGVNHDNNLSGDGNSIPLGLASSIKLQDPSIYTTATYGGSVSIEGIMPRLQLKTNNSSYNTLGEGGMTVTHPASSVGGGYTTCHYGEKMSLSYNDGDYYLHTMDTTKSGLSVTYKGAPNVKAYYNYSGISLTNDNGATNEYVNVDSIKNWNSVYDTVENYSGSWTGGGGSIDTIPVAVISPLVTGFSGESAYLGIESTALNLSSYVPVSAIGVDSNYGWVNKISGRNISAYNAATAYYAYTANRSYLDRNGNEITSYYQPKLTITGDAGTITSINGSAVGASIPEGWELVAGAGIEIVDDAENNQTTISVTAAGGNPEVESYVQTNSASIDDAVSTYQSNSGSYLTQETDWTNTITAASSYAYSESVAQIPAPFDPTYISGVIDDKLDKSDIGFDNNSTYVTGISGKEISASRANNATYATESFMADQANNAMTALTAKYDEKGHSLYATYSSLYDLSSFVNINSANWEDATTAYQTNSASYLTSHQAISANEWNSNYDTVLANSSTWTNGGFTGEVYGISGVSPNVDVYIDQQTLWISAGGFASQSDINYLSGAIGDVETLLSQL